MKYVDVANTQDLQPGQSLCIELEDGQPIALFNVNGEIFALENTCPHAGGPLGEGALEGEVVSCPWHGWKFNVRTGYRLKNPIEEWQIACYPTVVQDNIIQIVLPDPQKIHEGIGLFFVIPDIGQRESISVRVIPNIFRWASIVVSPPVIPNICH